MSTASIPVHLIAADGSSREIAGRAGHSLMRAAIDADIDAIKADCGGLMSCATCHVYVDPAWAGRLPAATDEERSMLEMTAAPRQATSRLSCQIVLGAALAGLTVRLPDTQY